MEGEIHLSDEMVKYGLELPLENFRQWIKSVKCRIYMFEGILFLAKFLHNMDKVKIIFAHFGHRGVSVYEFTQYNIFALGSGGDGKFISISENEAEKLLRENISHEIWDLEIRWKLRSREEDMNVRVPSRCSVTISLDA